MLWDLQFLDGGDFHKILFTKLQLINIKKFEAISMSHIMCVHVSPVKWCFELY